jgi:phage-related minor tail protein
MNFGMGTLMAEGGVVTRATTITAGEAGPEAIIPLDRLGEFGGGGGGVTINVNGGDPNAVVNALRTYMRQNGSIPIKVSNNY